MKVLVTDTEVDLEVEEGETIEWVSQGGNHLHAKLIRREPYKSPIRDYGLGPGGTVNTRKFDGVTPEMEQK